MRKQGGGISNWRMSWGKIPGHAKVMLLIASFALLAGFISLSSCSSGESLPSAAEAPATTNATPQPPTAGFTGGPRLSFDKDSVALGEVPIDIPINYAFSFKNTGSAPLNIIDIRAKALVGC